MATVKLSGVGKAYSQQLILENINLSVEKGEFVTLVGPSGCGKSTLLRLVAGLESLSCGSILINNRCVNKIPASQRDMAMVFQNYALYPHMNVYENMAYGLKMRRIKKDKIKQKVNEVAAILQLSEYLHRKPRELSGGQRQRVAMGRAIVREPAVFLFDEPLSNLDAKLRAEMRYEIKKLHQQLNTTCLYVTHDQTEAMTMASKVVILNQGRIEQMGTPQLLYQQPASLFVAGFTGYYPINLIPGKIDLHQQNVVTEFGAILPLKSLEKRVEHNQSIIVGIRPEHLRLVSKTVQNSILIRIEFIDDMGSDKLVKVKTHCGNGNFWVRASADMELVDGAFALELIENKANLFDKASGLRLGGWNA